MTTTTFYLDMVIIAIKHAVRSGAYSASRRPRKHTKLNCLGKHSSNGWHRRTTWLATECLLRQGGWHAG